MRKPVTLGTVCIICFIALLAADRIALAQAGSTGGTLGNTDKSASGGAPAPARYGTEKTQGTVALANRLKGSWQWRAVCGLLPASGVFEIRDLSGNRFSGEFISDFPGRLYGGTINGDRISFKRELNVLFENSRTPQTWTASLSQGEPYRMQGDIVRTAEGLGPCTFEASK
jgi:hypothetical protein